MVGDTGVTFATNQRVSVADTAALRPLTANYTIEFWIKRNGNPSSNEMIFAKSGSGGVSEFDVLLLTTGVIRARIGTTELPTSGVTITDNAWHHVVISVTRSATSTIYVDGVSRGTVTAPAYTLNNTGPLSLGARVIAAVASLHLNGSLDEVALYIGTALSGARARCAF